MATITEVQMNLFDLPHGYAFAHCVDANFVMGAGIAKEFEERYHMRENLRNRYDTSPLLPDGSPDITIIYYGAYPFLNVYNLVTKAKVYGKPTYESLRKALMELADLICIDGVTKLAMPRIGCGLDGLDWSKVKPMIEEVFKDVDMEIVICYL